MPHKLIWIAVPFAIGCLLAAGPCSSRDQTPWPEKRAIQIQQQVRSAGPQAVIFIGDSITERAPLPDHVCGHVVINAGISSLDVANYQKTLADIGDFRAAAIVVALGTNDSKIGHARDFDVRYIELLATLARRSSRLVLVGLPPIEPNHKFSDFFDNTAHAAINAKIRLIAASASRPFVDLATAMPSGDLTVDGVHPSADGYKPLLDTTWKALTAALDCSD
jgi:lysophospholipase L1-like esterase